MFQPYQIRLVINKNEEGYTASWIESDGQESQAFPLALPLTEKNADDLRWYLEIYFQFPGVGDRTRASDIESKLQQWGEAMFKAVFDTSEGTNVYRNLMAAASNGQPSLLTIGASEPDILVQPWEIMRDKEGPLVFQGVTIRRQLKGSGRARPQQLSLPLNVLLIVSRPHDIGFIDPRNSIAPLLDALDALPEGQAEIEFCDPPTLARLEEIVSKARKANRPFHIVHFDGHGTYLRHTGIGALAFEKDDATTRLVTGRDLGDLLARLDVPLVILEACRTADLSDKPVYGSVAPALLESGVGSVIAFSHSVHVKAARLLVERFYKELADGLTIGQALEEARARLRAEPARWLHLGPNAESVDLQDWFIPQLYQVGQDPALVKQQDGSAKIEAVHDEKREQNEASDEQALHGFPPPPMYRFHGRAMELLEMERAFRRYTAVLLSGMGGMGKTSLAREGAAWWLRKNLFEATIFCSFEQKAGSERVVQLIGQALEGNDFSNHSAEEQWDRAVKLFRSRRVLLVWDNFESTLPIYQQGEASGVQSIEDAQAGQGVESILSFGSDARAQLLELYRDLTSGTPKGRLLVTCRPADTGLPGIKEIELSGLARPDSLHLLSAVLDLKSISTTRPGYNREAIDDLLTALNDHPLSIELVAPHLKTLSPGQIRAEFSHLLERFADDKAFEARNRSLLASLEFSKKRLSEAAQKALPYLAWFERGTFEDNILDFTGLKPEAWDGIRAELVATALVNIEEDIQINKRPYVRFHPTLPYAAKPTDVPDLEAAEHRFIQVYLSMMRLVDNALRGREPALGMTVMAREEANFRSAITRAFQRGDRREGSWIANTLNVYLQMAGRLRDRNALVEWVRAQLPQQGGLDEVTCEAIREHAWSRISQGHANEAIQMMKELIARLETEGTVGDADSTFQIAMSYHYLGRTYSIVNRSDLALGPLQKAITMYEQIGNAQRFNLAASLGDIANAYSDLGKLDAALVASEQELIICRELGKNRAIAAGLGRSAAILTQQQRYVEADALYSEALSAAHAAGDLELQGALLQHQGGLQHDIGNYDKAIDLYKLALTFFQQAANTRGEMQTSDLLATNERRRGHFDAAEAWYMRSRELALQSNDQYHLSIVAQNLGLLYQNRAEQATDENTKRIYLRKAAELVKESLEGAIKFNDTVGAAASYFQLGVLHWMLGEIDQAETNVQHSLSINETLNLPNVYKDYAQLAEIARARGDIEAAARWQAKYEAKWAEVQRLRRGENASGKDARLPDQLIDGLLALIETVAAARASNTSLSPEVAEALAQLSQLPPPLGAVGAFLQAVAAGQPFPPIPEGLPQVITDALKKLDMGSSE